MEITKVTTIKLEDAEIAALQTIKDAYINCVVADCFDCEECPLYIVDGGCIGMLADKVLDRLNKGGK